MKVNRKGRGVLLETIFRFFKRCKTVHPESGTMKKPISVCMNHQLYNDQAHIADSFCLYESYISQTARLAHFKINSYKLSLIKAAFCKSREELEHNLKGSLFNFIDTAGLLADLGFFKSEIDN